MYTRCQGHADRGRVHRQVRAANAAADATDADADAATEATDTAANAVAPGVQTVHRPIRGVVVH